MPGAFTPFMGGMFGAGAMSTGSSGYYRSGTDWQDPQKDTQMVDMLQKNQQMEDMFQKLEMVEQYLKYGKI